MCERENACEGVLLYVLILCSSVGLSSLYEYCIG